MAQTTHPSPFEGRLVRLRARETRDVDPINAMFNAPEVLDGLLAALPIPVSTTMEWLRSSRQEEGSRHFAIETLDGELIGICGLEDVSRRSRTAIAGIWLGRDHWSKGYGTDAMRVLCRFGFAYMNLQRIGLHVYAPNERAIRSYEKVGFKREGILRRDEFHGGRYVDTYVMGLLADELIEDQVGWP